MDSSSFVWMDGRIVPSDEAQVHVLTHGLHYGTGVFEGIRAYDTPAGTAVFRLTEHIERLHASAAAYRIPLGVPVADLVAACKEVLRVNGMEAGYLRPLAFYGLGALGLNPAGAAVQTIVAAWRWGAYLGEEGVARGIRAHVSSWRRVPPSSFIPSAKGSGQYLNSVMAKQEAISAGYDEAIMLNADGNVSEATGENIFVVRDGVAMTPPASAGILDGITRRTVMTLLADDGVEVRERDVTRGELYGADEVFLTGTAAEVTPVREIDGRQIGDPGPVTRRTQELFREAATGKTERYRHWLELVDD